MNINNEMNNDVTENENEINNNVSEDKSALTPANYVGEVQDIQARQAIEIMGNTIQSLFYGDIIKNQIKQEVTMRQKEMEQNVLSVVDNKIDEKIKERGLTKQESDNLDKSRKKKVSQYLGKSKIKNKDNPRYVLFSQYFFGVIRNKCKAKFHIEDYTDVTPDQYLDVLHYINSITYNQTEELNIYKNAKKALDEAYNNKEWDGYAKGAKMKRYYEGVFVFKTMELPTIHNVES